MAKAGILVFVALNQDDRWKNYGYEDVQHEPIVMFALRPELGAITTDFVRSKPQEATATLVWYRWLTPPRLSDLLRNVELRTPLGTYDPRNSVLLAVDIQQTSGFSWIIDASGALVPGSLVVADNYDAELLDPDEFRLVAIPPGNDAQEHAEQSGFGDVAKP